MISSLKVNNISKSYSGNKVLEGISFEVNSGNVVGLLGPNGAGKTTCFYIVCGLIKASTGNVYIDDIDITTTPIHQRANMGLSYLPQEVSIFRKLSVEDNIKAILQLQKDLTPKEQNIILNSLIDEFGLNKIRKNLGIELSGGERRRTEIARCLATRPKFILLDEPFAGVDPISVIDIQQIIWSLQQKNIGVLITDHNYREILDTCDNSYVLYDGEIIASGDKNEILYNESVRAVYLGESR